MRMASTISPLQTPWQLHTRALSGRSAAVAWLASASSASGIRCLAAGADGLGEQLGAAGVAEQDRARGLRRRSSTISLR